MSASDDMAAAIREAALHEAEARLTRDLALEDVASQTGILRERVVKAFEVGVSPATLIDQITGTLGVSIPWPIMRALAALASQQARSETPRNAHELDVGDEEGEPG